MSASQKRGAVHCYTVLLAADIMMSMAVQVVRSYRQRGANTTTTERNMKRIELWNTHGAYLMCSLALVAASSIYRVAWLKFMKETVAIEEV